MKRIRFISLLLCLMICSCAVTKKMWQNDDYKESFQQFFVGDDGKHAVFLGNEYHYIFFDELGIIREILASGSRDLLYISVDKTRLKVMRDNSLVGKVTIEAFNNSPLAPAEIATLKGLGFKNNKVGVLSLIIDLKGVRYASSPQILHETPELDRRYIISVQQENSLFGKIGKAALTPITITADAVLMIGKTILTPFNGN